MGGHAHKPAGLRSPQQGHDTQCRSLWDSLRFRSNGNRSRCSLGCGFLLLWQIFPSECVICGAHLTPQRDESTTYPTSTAFVLLLDRISPDTPNKDVGEPKCHFLQKVSTCGKRSKCSKLKQLGLVPPLLFLLPSIFLPPVPRASQYGRSPAIFAPLCHEHCALFFSFCC